MSAAEPSKFKTLEGVEFCDLFSEVEKSGYKQADVARELHISRGAVNMLLAGDRNPRPATMAAMRELAGRLRNTGAHGEVVEDRGAKSDRLHDQLTYLKENNEALYEAARETVKTLHEQAMKAAQRGTRRAGGLIKPSSGVPASGRGVAKSVARRIAAKTPSADSAEFSRQREAGETGGHKAAPLPASDHPSKTPPLPHEDQD